MSGSKRLMMVAIGKALRVALFAVALGLAACGGTTGAPGPAGPTGSVGPAGAPGSGGAVSAVPITTATEIKATITAVHVPSSGQPVVNFTLTDQNGVPLSGLPAADVSFAIAKLVPAGTQLSGYPGLPAPAPLLQPQWQSYLYAMVDPADSAASAATPVVGTQAEPQAVTESGASGTLVDNGNGTYQYTFNKDIASDPVVSYVPTLVHRVGLEIRGLAPANSPVYTFIPSTGATSGFDADDAVDGTACVACHQQLAFHGGARTNVQYCVICHNPSSVDPSSGNTLDFSVLIHKIHMGDALPSVLAGTHYYIYGYRGAVSDFSSVAYPQSDLSGNNAAVSGSGTRFCTTCHTPNDSNAPQSGNYQTTITSASCGACHDNVNFATGQNHGPGNLIVTDADCVTCHGPTSTIDNGALQVVAAHTTPVDAAVQKFQYKIVSVVNTAPGQTPSVTLEVLDPTQNDAPYDILSGSSPFQQAGARLAVDLAWPTTAFNNVGSGGVTANSGTPNQPVSIDFQSGVTANGDGTFTASSPIPIPSTAVGSGQVAVEGRAVVALANLSGSGTSNVQLGIAGVSADFPITDPEAVAPAQIVSIAKCDACHHNLTMHGENRSDNIELCAACHNANATDIGEHVAASGACAPVGSAGANPEQPIDFKVLIHEIHASAAVNASGTLRYPNGVTICGYGANPTTFNVAYPGNLADCNACHVNASYYPVNDAVVEGTTVVTNNRTTLADDVVISPNAAVCASCHTSALAQQHMIQNGGNFAATKTATGALVSGSTETCALCHGPGGVADVKVVHELAEFPE